jgi:type VI secretion system secreted protein Hcp
MAVQIVLKLGDIKGETIVKDDKANPIVGGIDCLSWSWGMTQTGSSAQGSGGGSGASDVCDLTITKKVDQSSPQIYAHCQTGQSIKGDVILSCWKVAGGTTEKPNKVEYIKIKMGGTVMISSVHSGEPQVVNGQTTDLFLETVSIHFSQASFDYTTQTSENKADAVFPSGTISIGT